ncbi:hypothetical protein BDV95DRAFT_644279 [Massariosphaeria phaeospora]|uniref:Uncharacterized protein n=1 Tax=Massariosphaeria phaeospora TaxID=100035 RepID=A0A7C8MGX4_9PLEO|nr:hypothetical protein BDV95DRAFT_644279 [Massariosphaeria phaeospora]
MVRSIRGRAQAAEGQLTTALHDVASSTALHLETHSLFPIVTLHYHSTPLAQHPISKMKSIISLATLLALSLASPIIASASTKSTSTLTTPKQAPQPATVYLRIHHPLSPTPLPANLNTPHQAPLSPEPQSSVLAIKVGQTLSRDTIPILAHSIAIESVSAGSAVAGQRVEEDDGRVGCRVRVGWGSEGMNVSMGDGAVVLNGEKAVRITGVWCGLSGAV